jgi:hypothetical protein
MESRTPIVNSSNIQNYVSKIVYVPGTVQSIQMDQAMLESCDQGQILIHLMPVLCDNKGTKCVEGTAMILGKVQEDMSVQEIDTESMRGSYGNFG